MVLFLASKSKMRHELLGHSKIPFVSIGQSAIEERSERLSLEEQVMALASLKMDAVHMADVERYQSNQRSGHAEGSEILVLTADTLTQSPLGTIEGKPRSRQESLEMIQRMRGWATVATAYVLEKKKYAESAWKTTARDTAIITAQCYICIDDVDITQYINEIPTTVLAGGLAVESYGMQFIKSIQGSYSTILGLPLCELRSSLHAMGFFSFS